MTTVVTVFAALSAAVVFGAGVGAIIGLTVNWIDRHSSGDA